MHAAGNRAYWGQTMNAEMAAKSVCPIIVTNKSCQKPTIELAGWLGEKLNISPLDIGHEWSAVGLKVIINVDTNHRCLYSIYILQHYTKQCPKE